MKIASKQKVLEYYPKAYEDDVKSLIEGRTYAYIYIPYLFFFKKSIGDHISIPLAWDDAYLNILKKKLNRYFYLDNYQTKDFQLFDKYQGNPISEKCNSVIEAFESALKIK